MNRKFLVIGDYIISENDGDRHYISAKQLVRLYNLKKGEYELFDHDRNPRDISTSGKIILGPLRNGNYLEYIKQFRQIKNTKDISRE